MSEVDSAMRDLAVPGVKKVYAFAVGEMQVFLKTLTGRTITLDVTRDELVDTFKMKVFAREEIPVDLSRIMFSGRELEDGRTLCSYGVCKEVTLDLRCRPPRSRPVA